MKFGFSLMEIMLCNMSNWCMSKKSLSISKSLVWFEEMSWVSYQRFRDRVYFWLRKGLGVKLLMPSYDLFFPRKREPSANKYIWLWKLSLWVDHPKLNFNKDLTKLSIDTLYQRLVKKEKKKKSIIFVLVGHNVCIQNLIPNIWYPWKAPMRAVRIATRIR